MRNKNFDKRLLTGIVILIIGAVLLVSNFGLVGYNFRRYFLRWEMLLIVVGLISFISSPKKGFGIVLIVIGGALYARDFFNLDYNFWQLFWPTMLIIIGLVIIFHKHSHHTHCRARVKTISENPSSPDILDEVSILGSTERIISPESFQGGKLTTIFGGQKLIFTKGKLDPTKNTLEIFALFGGFEIVVPDNWNVKINVTPIFGGFAEKKRFFAQNTEPESEIIITGTVIFGGGEIKRF